MSDIDTFAIGVLDFLAILAAACFIVSSILLAKSIKFRAEDLKNLKKEGGELSKNIEKMGSPGRIIKRNLIFGWILNALGYGLLVMSIVLRHA
ncbi:MAG: hypothetical protein JXA50_11500 [Deltaproteobacteria bacterium]|nr:hypothetical protein [Deltaproteobacteria bacterium]